MSQPVRLSDQIVADARLVGDTLDRSMAGQIEHWVRLGRAVEEHLNLQQIMVVKQAGKSRTLADLLDSVGSEESLQRLDRHLSSLPFPHYQPDPETAGLFIRTDSDGTRRRGRFVQRQFVEV